MVISKASRTKIKKIENIEDIEYIIYVRKSTDEKSWKQTQSIEDQIKACYNFAIVNNIKLMGKNSLFTHFDFKENEFIGVKKKTNTETIEDEALREKTKDLFIIEEQKSWKTPGIRKKWAKLISLIRTWKIKWILSYSPDRQARNMVEWWEIINLVDEWRIDLKYTNFHFENNASGKMMLWMWFVFSKQYSDKLSEDSARWSYSAHAKWKAVWIYKLWYEIDEETGYHIAHPTNFPLMREAFMMKLHKNESDENIAQYLNENWFKREFKKEKWREWKAIDSKLYQVWRDPFYYGIFVYWEQEVDLREKNDYYEPIITEEEYNQLIYQIWWVWEEKISKTHNKVKPHIDNIMAVHNEMVITEDGLYNFNCTLPNFETRIVPKYKKVMQETWNKNLTYWDIVLPHQIKYVCNQLKLSITYEEIEKEILKVLKKIKFSEEDYGNLLAVIKERIDRWDFDIKEQKRILNIQIWKMENNLKDFIKNNLWKQRDEREEKIYQEEKRKLEKVIDDLNNQMDDVNKKNRDVLFEYEVIMDLFRNAHQIYKNGSYVQKRKINEILFLNIKITPRKSVILELNEGLDFFFNINGAECEDWTCDTRIFNPLLYHWANPAYFVCSSCLVLCYYIEKK